MLKLLPTKLRGLKLIQTRKFEDERGAFSELWQKQRYPQIGVEASFVQDNLSFSKKNVLRGMHFQSPSPQGKLVSVLWGSVLDVAVDIRPQSETFGQWESFELSAENGRQLYLPEGFAHGFCVLSEQALFQYKCSDYYRPDAERTLIWNDPDVGIEWPVASPLLSPKDAEGIALSEFSKEVLAF